MIGMVCDKCGITAEIRDEAANMQAIRDGWATLISAVNSDAKLDLCPACSIAWDKIRQETIRRWLSGRSLD